jgi:hypothetical protein
LGLTHLARQHAYTLSAGSAGAWRSPAPSSPARASC